MLVVHSAGNDNENECTRNLNRNPHTLTVCAITVMDAYAIFSNYGECVELCAPGSAVWTVSTTADDNTAKLRSGTSFASALVAGIAAVKLANDDDSELLSTDNLKKNLRCSGTQARGDDHIVYDSSNDEIVSSSITRTRNMARIHDAEEDCPFNI